jgi:hypothetical protein
VCRGTSNGGREFWEKTEKEQQQKNAHTKKNCSNVCKRSEEQKKNARNPNFAALFSFFLNSPFPVCECSFPIFFSKIQAKEIILFFLQIEHIFFSISLATAKKN